ncbi:MAG: LysR family transcriptional regulator [Pseudomonadota bacterium]
MNWSSISFDWNHIRSFLVTADEGSLSAAARALELSQPTLSRQVNALENELGVTLFERGNRKMQLTGAGTELREQAAAMGRAALELSLIASAQSQAVEGVVRITATNMVATHQLPPILEALREAAPAIEIIVQASNDIQDISKREADIAIRHARPTNSELIGRLVAKTTAHMYASADYLDRIGRPQSASDLSNADFIGFEHASQMLPAFHDMGVHVTRENFKICTASGTASLAFVQQGLGIGFFATEIADQIPGLEMVMETLPPFDVPIWLVTHRELHTSQRIRLVFDLLGEHLAIAS